MKIFSLILCLLLFQYGYAQNAGPIGGEVGGVGINTTDPQETLHVNGAIRVNDISGRTSVKVVGVDANGTLNII